MNAHLLFTERQHFRQWWLWLLLIGITLPVVYTIMQRYLTLSQAAETNYSNLFPLSAILPLLILLLYIVMRLDTEIREDGIYVRFFPFALRLKKYGWEEIERVYIRTYSPLKEYGGWGIRYGGNGRALNISGNSGLQLELQNGKKLLIGTRKPEEMEAALQHAGLKKAG